MAELYFTTNYLQTRLPDIRDAVVTHIAGTVAGSTVAAGTPSVVPGIYGPGSYITRVGLVAAEGSTLPDCTVDLGHAGGVLGTLYSALGTSAAQASVWLGKPLTTTAWLRVLPQGTVLDTATRVIVDYVHEA